MKTFKSILCIAIGMMVCMFTACSNSKKTPGTPHHETSIEGEKINKAEIEVQGVEMFKTLDDDGSRMIERPFVYFVGTAKIDNKQTALTAAQRDAYSKISMMLQNAVQSQAEQGTISNNGKAHIALREHWEQVSSNLTKACMPLGSATIEYHPALKMYDVTTKIGIRGDRFKKLLDEAGSFKPKELQGEELKQFIEANRAIMEAAKGNFNL